LDTVMSQALGNGDVDEARGLETLEQLTPDQEVLVLVSEQGEIQGVVTFGISEGVARLQEIATTKKKDGIAGRGIFLMDEFFRQIKERGARGAVWDTSWSNKDAVRFYTTYLKTQGYDFEPVTAGNSVWFRVALAPGGELPELPRLAQPSPALAELSKRPLRPVEGFAQVLQSFLGTPDALHAELRQNEFDTEKTARLVWLPRAEKKRDEMRGALDAVLRKAVLGELETRLGKSPTAEALVDTIFDDAVFGYEPLRARLGTLAVETNLDVAGLRDGLRSRVMRRVQGLVEGNARALEDLGITEALVRRAKALLNPANRKILEAAYREYTGTSLELPSNEALFIDGFFLRDTPPQKAEALVRRYAAQAFVLANLKGTESVYARAFSRFGILRRTYDAGNPLELLVKNFAGDLRYVLLAGTPVEDDRAAVADKLGMMVSQQVYLMSRLDASEFVPVAELVWQVEYLKKQLEDKTGGIFPEFTESVLKAVFGFLEQLSETQAARELMQASA
ncbi:MAG TPA: hypothetical protein VL688_04000, partial [Verrucomicrobiae bacterium]|nr:hypothetical protein [Verrucomicrobiae bacterium]